MIRVKVKGDRTHLTYRVEIFEYFGSWRCEVREPELVPARFWGAIPAYVRYVNPFYPGRDAECWAENLTPGDIQELGRRAVRAYESWKLAWEKQPSKEIS